jgi:uncharacterized protein (DUF488 family)
VEERNAPVSFWTIGHSTRPIEEFLALLKEQKIEALADVRRYPGSRRHPQFGQEKLAASLAAAGVDYIHVEEHPYTSAARIVDGKLSYAAAETQAGLRLMG